MKKAVLFFLIFILFQSIFLAQTASKIYFTRFHDTFGRVYSMDLDGSNDAILVNNIDRPIAVAIDWNSSPKKIYAALSGDNKIVRYDIDGTNPVDVITGITSISDIELDLVNRKIFWVKDSATEEKISKGDMDGTNQNITDVYAPSSPTNDDWWGIALDVTNQLLYLTIRGNVHVDSEVWKMTTSGGSRTKILDGGDDAALDNPHDIEYYNGHIYWGDDSGILRANTDGTGLTNSIATATGNIGLAIDGTNNRVYWTTSSSVKGADIGGGNETTPYSGGTSPLQGIDTDYNPAALPVELTSFYASLSETSVTLNWETATEVNNYGFEIERAINNEQLTMYNWENIGFVQGYGNSNSPKQYEFVDDNLDLEPYLNHTLKYRLKQIDTDGTYEYFNQIVDVNLNDWITSHEEETIPVQFSLSQNFPNPFNPSTRIEYTLESDEYVSLNIYNNLGQHVITLVDEFKRGGSHAVEFNPDNLTSGVYLYELKAGDNHQVRKMILAK